MLLPYASDRLPTRRPVVTVTLLSVYVLLTAWVVFSQRHPGGRWTADVILTTFGIVPARFNILTLFTYSFFHESFGHLLMNVFYLWVFGGGVEEAVGRGRYLLWYLAGGAVGGALQLLVTDTLLPPTNGTTPIVGASAACTALVGLFAVRYYRTRLSFVGLSYRPHVVSVVSLFLAYEIGMGVWNLFQGSAAGGVAHWAHVGGFIFGLTCAQAFRLEEAGQRAYRDLDARQAMDKSTPGDAIKRWESVLAKEPDNAEARAELARAWLLLGDPEQTAAQAEKAVEAYLSQNRRAEAARIYALMHEKNIRMTGIAVARLFMLGSALEDQEQFELAAETLRAASARDPDSPAAETALLKVIGLYLHRLNRREEALILARLFLERYPLSQWRSMAEELRRAAETADK